MSKILGIDFGTKKIGMALSDEGQKVAFPKGVYPNIEPFLRDTIADLILREDISEIVVGLPKALGGEETKTSKAVREFSEHLQKNFRLPFHFEDESFTSRAVETSGAAPPHKTDASAAALILQSFLDRRNKLPCGGSSARGD